MKLAWTVFFIRTSLTGLVLALPLVASEAQMAQVRPIGQFLEQNNWVPLSIPDSKMRPGSVIKVTKKGNAVEVQWLGDIRHCGIADKELGLFGASTRRSGSGRTSS